LKKIAAVVVTHNRKKLLGECLDALLRQGRALDSIIIIDNSSNDGTKDFLQERYLNNSVFDYICLPDNIGGAGGFHEGIARGLQKNFDWLWLMDDDTEPAENALEVLVSSPFFENQKTGALLCRIMNRNNSGEKSKDPVISNEAVSRCELIFAGKKLTGTDFEQPFLKVSTYPLLGILVKSDVIRKVGNVRKEFFIYCDDADFTLRISDFYQMVLIRDSRILHKATSAIFVPKTVLGKRCYFLPIESFWREYYECRNYLYLFRQRLGLFKALLSLFNYLKPIVKILVFGDHKVRKIAIYFKAIKDALSGNLGKNIDPQKFNPLPVKTSNTVRLTGAPTGKPTTD